DVGKFSKPFDAAVLDDQQTGFDILEHKPEAGNLPRCAPNIKLVRVAPDTEMKPGPLNRRGQFRQNVPGDGPSMFEDQRLTCLFGRQEGQRDFRKAAFFRSEAGPEGGVDDYFDGARVGYRRKCDLAASGRFSKMPREMGLDRCGYAAG